MATIDERTENLKRRLFDNFDNQSTVRQIIRTALQEVARDQRHACADAVTEVDCKPCPAGVVHRSVARTAVMNAELK